MDNVNIYKVGGFVRDRLLGLPPKDIDYVVVGSTPQEMVDNGFKKVGADFPVFLNKEGDEYALARTEKKQGHGYNGFDVYAGPEVTLEQDLMRRDLTINAMACDDKGNLYDPYGGEKDLYDGILRHVSDSFTDDPVRVLRVARFAARYNFTVSDETVDLMKKMAASGELEELTPERVWAETDKALSSDKPSIYFETLRNCNALAVIYPEIDNLFGIEQTKEHHPEIDTGVHTMMTLDRAAELTPDKSVRFSALTHDLGKALTPKDELPKHFGHEKRGVKIIRNLCKRLRVPNRYSKNAIFIGEHHGTLHRAMELKANTAIKLLHKMDAFRNPDRLKDIITACQADAQGRKGCRNKPYHQADRLMDIYSICKKVTAQPFVKKGLRGVAIKNSILQEQIRRVGAEFESKKTIYSDMKN